MSDDQGRAPILEAIQAYREAGTLPFTTPGHKVGRGIDEYTAEVIGRSAFRSDIPELGGLDDRHESKGVMTQAQELAASLYGAEQSFFSTNGSSLSAHTALLTLANPGEKVLIARNMHKSVVAAIILAGVHPVWLYPPVDEQMNVHHGVTPEQVAEALRNDPDVKAVLVTSPDYYGVASDLRRIATVAHEHGVPLAVDEAWGPHFPFHPDLPPSGMESGADISLGSIHKTMGGIQQSSIINVQGSLVDKTRMQLVFDLYETTSPTSLIYGSIDGTRRHMALQGRELWGRALDLARRVSAAATEIPGMSPLSRDVLQLPGASALDETKVVIDVRGLGMTGVQAADWLEQHCHITVELADQRRIMALVTLADSDESVDRLIAGLRELAAWAGENSPGETVTMPPMADMETELVQSPREAILGPAREIRLVDAPGQIAAEMISPYPPGIPAITPGERFTEPIVEFLRAVLEMGIAIPDASDPSLETVRVVA